MNFSHRALACVAALVVAGFAVVGSAQRAAAQGFLVDSEPHRHWRMPRPIPRTERDPQSYRIAELEVNATLDDSVARVQVSQVFENTGPGQIEASFIFPLPYDGAIDQLTLLVDGKEYPAKLRSAQEARERYEAIVRKSRDPALLEWIGNGMFQTSVFPIPSGAKRTVTLRYTQLLR
jgi:Ca-activated chloride channel family protein